MIEFPVGLGFTEMILLSVAVHPDWSVTVTVRFIGLEMAENLHRQGIKVNIVEMANQVMAPLDLSMAQIVHKELVDKGVKLILNDGVKEFTDENDKK